MKIKIRNIIKKVFTILVFWGLIPLIRLFNFNLKRKKSNKILVISLNFIGDVLFCTPAIRMIKKYDPSVLIDVWVKGICKPVVNDNPDINEIFTDQGKHTNFNSIFSIVAQVIRNSKNIIKMWRNNYDIVFDMSACFESVIYTTIVGRKKRYGLVVNKDFQSVYHKSVWGKDKPYHLKYHYCKVVNLAGIPDYDKECRYVLNVNDSILKKVKNQFVENCKDGIVTIAPFAGWETKEWSTDRFIELAEKIVEKYNSTVYFLGSPSEHERLSPFSDRFSNKIVNLLGKTSLMESAALIDFSKLFIGLDSSQAHFAEAQKTKSIVLFGSTNPIHSAIDSKDHVAVFKKLPCSAPDNILYCDESYRTFVCPNAHRCMDEITVEEIFDIAIKLLS